MLQRLTNPKGYTVTAADTNAHAFPTAPAAFVWLTTPSGNSGTVTITDAGGSGGIVLGAGVGISIPAVKLGPILSLDSLSYQFSHSGDTLNYLVLA